VDAAVRERRADEREITAVDEDGALPEVPLERLVRVADHAERPQQVRDRAVAVPREALGLEHRLVDVEGPSREAAVRVQHGGEGRDVGDEGGGGDRARVHHGVRRNARLGRERDRVERVAARLDPDARADGLRAVQVERERVGQRLRDRLKREADPRVARLVHGAVDRRDHDPEERRVDVGELRDVRRERAAVEPAEPVVEVVEEVLDRAAERLGGVVPRGVVQPLDPTLDLHRRADLLQTKRGPGADVRSEASMP
jgi:hypothetical protein